MRRDANLGGKRTDPDPTKEVDSDGAFFGLASVPILLLESARQLALFVCWLL